MKEFQSIHGLNTNGVGDISTAPAVDVAVLLHVGNIQHIQVGNSSDLRNMELLEGSCSEPGQAL